MISESEGTVPRDSSQQLDDREQVGAIYESMKADDSGKTPSPVGVPSCQRLGGSRWFLQERFGDVECHNADEWDNAIVRPVIDPMAPID